METDLRDSQWLKWLISVLETTPEGSASVDGAVIYWNLSCVFTTKIEVFSLSKWGVSWLELELDGDAMRTTWMGIGRSGEKTATASMSQTLFVLEGRHYKLLCKNCVKGAPIGGILNFWHDAMVA